MGLSTQGAARRIREKAATVLGQLGDARAIGPLNEALEDPAPEVVKSAREALALLERASEAQRVFPPL